MKTIKNISIALTLFLSYTVAAQQTPGATQTQTITITGATAHIGNGNVVTNATIVLKAGKIAAITKDANPNQVEGEVIAAAGKHVYPGFIALNTTLGLVEVGAVRPSNDDDELGKMLPHVRALIAYNAESKVVESMRPNGILMAQSRPIGGRISGKSSVMQLDAWNWEDAAYHKDDGVWINWPRSMKRGRWWLGEASGYTPDKTYQKEVAELVDFFKNASAFAKADSAVMHPNLAFTAMNGVINGKENIYIVANGAREIADIIAFKNNMGLTNIVLVGAYEAPRLASTLAAENIPVILQRVQQMPANSDHDYDYNFKLAKVLTAAGVTVALGYDAEYWQVRNLPFYAGQLTGQGMSNEEALQLITNNPAKIVGISDTTGTLEVGKDATLFISKGNALDMRTNIISNAFIQGRAVSLESHQTKLYKRYDTKAKAGK